MKKIILGRDITLKEYMIADGVTINDGIIEYVGNKQKYYNI